jgi:hypothetical protein
LTCVLAISLLILQGTTLAIGISDGTTVTIDGYQVGLIFAEQAKAGDNSLHVQILDKKGLPVSGARVEISAMPVKDTQNHQKNMDSGAHTMDGMEGMSHSPATAPVHDMSSMGGLEATPTQVLSNEQFRKAGDYFGIITFSAAGHWMLNTHFSINGQALDADFPVNVVASHSASFGILAGFVGLNALIIWAASVTRRNLVSA